MADQYSVFRSAEGQALYEEAYDAVLRRWPVPYEEIYVPTRFGDTHVIASGAKNLPPLLLLHPAGGGAVLWIRNIEMLSQHFRIYAIDTISEPNKSKLTRPIHLLHQRKEFADWMLDLLNGLQIESTFLAGNSFGGFLTLNTAFYLPERVRKIVLISPAATFVPIPAWTWHFIPSIILGIMSGSKRMLLAPYHWIWQDFPKEECIGKLRATTAIAGRPRHWSPTVFRDDELRKIQVPVLLLIGDSEVIYKPADAIQRATSFVPNLRAEIVPNANHLAQYTNARVINERILEFFREAKS